MPQKRIPGGYVAPQPIAKRWTLVVPKIIREFFKLGVRYYETEDKKIWQADIFDSKLVPVKLKIRNKSESEAVNLSNEFVSRRHPK